MKFKYSQLPTVKSMIALAPIVPVTFKYRSNEFPTFALVDSGASGAMISTVVAEELGLNGIKFQKNQDLLRVDNFYFILLKILKPR